jgi:N-acyl-D-amino-acid deacylase
MREQRYDLIIRGASIYDGSGAPPSSGDLAVRGDRIVEVGETTGAAAREIDARGLAVAPGFIDVHSHDDFAIFVTPEMDFKTMQGVTTDVVGNCGLGAAPFGVSSRMFVSMGADAKTPTWDGYPGYFDAVDRNPPSLNVAVLAGHGTLRFAAMGNEKREPTESEMAAMRACLVEALDAGAVGLSTGLIYEPGRYARTEEIVALAREMAGGRGLYASHMRNEGAGLLDSVRETIHIGEAAGVPVQISHHKASGADNWGMVSESLKLIEQATARGMDVTADQYPYIAGSTILAAVVQNGALGGEARGVMGRVPAEKILFASTPRHPQYEGMTLRQLCDQWGMTELDAAQRILDEEGANAVVVTEMMNEEDVRTVMRHHSTMIGSDGIAAGSRPHPRLYGTFPRVLGHYARDGGLMPLHEAIHRMTGFPATKFRLEGRGFLRAGSFADIVVFDQASIIDTATYQEPRRYPEGINHVFVNGVEVACDGRHTGARPGRALRRA